MSRASVHKKNSRAFISRRDSRRGTLLAFGGTLSGAGYLVAYRAATAEARPEVLVLPLLLIAAVLGSVGVAVQGAVERLRFDRATVAMAGWLGGLTALGMEAVARAVAIAGAGSTAVVLRSQVLFVALGGLLLLHEKVAPRFWVGVGVALPGLALLCGGVRVNRESGTGLVWAVVAAMAFAGMQVVVRRNAHGVRLGVVNALRLWISVLVVAVVPGRALLVFQANSRVWVLVGVAALFGPVVSRLFLMSALRRISAMHCTMVTFCSPVAAFVFGGILLGEWPTGHEIPGSVLVLAGIMLAVAGGGGSLQRPVVGCRLSS